MPVSNGDRYVTWKAFLGILITMAGILLSLGAYVRSEMVTTLEKMRDTQVRILQEIARNGR